MRSPDPDEPATRPPAVVEAEAEPSATPGDVLLNDLRLPPRVTTWAERQGISLLSQLAAVTPMTLLGVRNLGRLSVVRTRRIIEAHFRVPWEELSERVADGVIIAQPTVGRGGWEALRGSMPEALRAADLADVDLPARARQAVERAGLRTVADLLARPLDELRTMEGLGARTAEHLLGVVVAFEARAPARRALVDTGLLASWRALLLEQQPVPRMVLTLRAGLGGRTETLHVLGEMLGVSREWVRQIEARAIGALRREHLWLRALRDRGSAALASGMAPLASLAGDPWWAGIVALPEALDYLGERLLDDEVRVIDVDGDLLLARCSQASFDQAWSDIERRAEQITLPAPHSAFLALLSPHRERVGEALAEVLRERLSGLLHTEAEGGDLRVLGFGNTQATAVMALLRASPTPLHADEIRERLGLENRVSFSRLPEEALLLGSGIHGLAHHFPDWATWMDRLVPAAVRLMEQDAPERQWLASELRADLLESIEIPEWLTDYHLSALLRHSGKVRYLGRHRVSLLDAPDGRLRFHEELVRILRDHGAPMPRQELVAALRRKTDAHEATLKVYLAGPQFLRCSEDLIGLMQRDLPGGAEALAEATEHLAGLLERREEGLGAPRLWLEVIRLGPIHAQWTPEMCLSVVRGDARFRLSTAGAVGLSSWGSVRVPKER